MTTLLACPFCGGEAHIVPSADGSTWPWVECGDCQACGPCSKSPQDAWNRRAPPVAIAHEAVDLLRELVRAVDAQEESVDCLESDLGRMLAYGDAVDKARAFLATPTASDRPVVRAEDAKDAERLDWIEEAIKRHAVVWIMPCGPDLRFVQFRHPGPSGEIENFPTVEGLRDAIDAAMLADRAASPSGDDRG